MKSLLRGSLVAATMLAAALPVHAFAGDSLSAVERAALGARADASLESLRGGLATDAAFSPAERDLLAAAQATTPGLQEQRAGFLVVDHDLAIVAWTLVIIAALIIIF